ncbi:purine nucleoside phosphorylase-like [Gigantopelta aegis]|uniref:purine nucleoside phosphorylase-like n=1 Tax=Gigantopelta aegis TaxID=1735272 RepID=UPI001B88B141|nr:purine nucleoside phosphorylase-like [Gigantopelta aegis]
MSTSTAEPLIVVDLETFGCVLRSESRTGLCRIEIYKDEDDVPRKNPSKIISVEQVSNLQTNLERKDITLCMFGETVTFGCTSRADLDDWTTLRPTLGIICGSGLGGIADELESAQVIPYHEIDGFPECTVPGHAGNLVFGLLSGVRTICMQGRLHLYEGHPAWLVTMPIRMMKLLGVKTLIVTNAAGGLNDTFTRGDIMIVKDHINLAGMAGLNPLVGPNEEKFGPRFPNMTTAYDRDLRKLARETAIELGFTDHLKEGVYLHLSGPNYETPSESRFLRMCGADAVGMSTAPEVVVARHAEMKILGISLITNMVITENDSDKTPPDHKEVMETATMRAKNLQLLVKTIAGRLQDQ